MKDIKVELLHYTNIGLTIIAARNCYDSKGNTYQQDLNLLKKLWKLGHHSMFEFIQLFYKIEGCSQVCMSQITRHRTFTFAVQSKRFTLKDKINTNYYVKSGNKEIDEINYKTMLEASTNIAKGNNDDLEYLVPMAYKTNIVLRADLRNLAHFFKLRQDKKAHKEIRLVANNMFDLLPKEIKEIII